MSLFLKEKVNVFNLPFAKPLPRKSSVQSYIGNRN